MIKKLSFNYHSLWTIAPRERVFTLSNTGLEWSGIYFKPPLYFNFTFPDRIPSNLLQRLSGGSFCVTSVFYVDIISIGDSSAIWQSKKIDIGSACWFLYLFHSKSDSFFILNIMIKKCFYIVSNIKTNLFGKRKLHYN